MSAVVKNLGLTRWFAWTLPASTTPRIGLLSLGKVPADPAATAQFDYFRVYRP